MYENYGTNLLIKMIYSGIENKESICYYENIYSELFKRTNFSIRKLDNKYFYRARPVYLDQNYELFKNKRDLQYPPITICRKGRLNDDKEQVVYMSNNVIGTIIELKEINFSDIFCIAKIECIQNDTYFHFAGIDKLDKFNTNIKSSNLKINELVKKLLKTKDTIVYNSTIAIWHDFNIETIMNDEVVDVGMAYVSTQSYKTNKEMYNIVVTPRVFDLKFRFLEASYCFLRKSKEREEIELIEINSGRFDTDGDIVWDKSFDIMMNEYKSFK